MFGLWYEANSKPNVIRPTTTICGTDIPIYFLKVSILSLKNQSTIGYTNQNLQLINKEKN